ncbi:ATP-binding protein [Streptosporangium sp. OZ121]|uniref:ATP-binding protein n=1 Tax=Streptosporangium sp. OZ121 TaxID=3444183 RepID=UPI003F7906B1
MTGTGKPLEISILPKPEEVSGVREKVRTALGPEHPTIERVELVVSELVTNAIQHSARGPVGDLIGVKVRDQADYVLVEVTDPGSPDSKPHVADNGPDAERGRGLLLVNVLTGGWWGVRDYQALGVTVWASIPHALPEVPPQASAWHMADTPGSSGG